jgi:hypothetical protein
VLLIILLGGLLLLRLLLRLLLLLLTLQPQSLLWHAAASRSSVVPRCSCRQSCCFCSCFGILPLQVLDDSEQPLLWHAAVLNGAAVAAAGGVVPGSAYFPPGFMTLCFFCISISLKAARDT